MGRLGSLLLLVTMIAACSNEEASWPRTTFEPNQWRAATEENRYVFVHDLIERKLLVGKSESTVQELLGPPTTIDQTGRQLSYVIREGGSGFSQVYSLDVVLSPSTRVVEEVGIRGD